LKQLVKADDTIEVPSIGDRAPRRLARSTLYEVIGPRYEELLTLVHNELTRSGYKELIAAGVVLTGGSSKMEGVIELAEEMFHVPVRLGETQFVKGLVDVVKNPIYATGVGLLLYSHYNRSGQQQHHMGAGVKGIWDRMKSWFQGNF
jgi:cell division protein FtsA